MKLIKFIQALCVFVKCYRKGFSLSYAKWDNGERICFNHVGQFRAAEVDVLDGNDYAVYCDGLRKKWKGGE